MNHNTRLQVRRVAVKAAAEARRQRRRQLGAAGLGFAQPAAVAGGGGGREVLGFGNMPPGFMQGLRGQQNAARFRVSVTEAGRMKSYHVFVDFAFKQFSL